MNTIQQRHRGGDERRFDPRFPEQCTARVLLPDHREVTGETVDLSSAGVCLTLPEALQLGAEYHFHIERHIAEHRQRLELVGRVCFCILRGDQFRIGIHCPDMQIGEAV
ncbi:MAG: PilZ domain-containing protein [Steroidobacteraceae bacterium]